LSQCMVDAPGNPELYQSIFMNNQNEFVLSKTNFTFASERNIKMKAVYTYWHWRLNLNHFFM